MSLSEYNKNETTFATQHNIIVGKAEIPAVMLPDGYPAWVLPGNYVIESREQAYKYACLLNDRINSSK